MFRILLIKYNDVRWRLLSTPVLWAWRRVRKYVKRCRWSDMLETSDYIEAYSIPARVVVVLYLLSTFSVDRIQVHAINPVYGFCEYWIYLHENSLCPAEWQCSELHHSTLKMHAIRPKESQFRLAKLHLNSKAHGDLMIKLRVVGVSSEKIIRIKWSVVGAGMGLVLLSLWPRIKVQFHWYRRVKSDDNILLLRFYLVLYGLFSGFGGFSMLKSTYFAM